MEISDIQLVRTIIETGSLSESCKRLHQSQPTLSRKLSRLEHQLGATLFHRSAKGLLATDIARFIVDQAEPIDRQLKMIRRHVERITNLETGVINLGVGPIVEQTLLPKLINRFWHESGDVRLSVVIGDEQILTQLFETSAVDLIIGPFPAREWEPRGFIARPMLKERFQLAARIGHPILAVSPLTLEAVRNYPLIAPKTGPASDADFESFGNPPKLRIDDYDLLKQLMLDTDAICIGPQSIFADTIHSERADTLELDLNAWWRSTLIVRPEALDSPIVSRVVDICERVAAEMQG